MRWIVYRKKPQRLYAQEPPSAAVVMLCSGLVCFRPIPLKNSVSGGSSGLAKSPQSRLF
jgi:hypothetical protein